MRPPTSASTSKQALPKLSEYLLPFWLHSAVVAPPAPALSPTSSWPLHEAPAAQLPAVVSPVDVQPTSAQVNASSVPVTSRQQAEEAEVDPETRRATARV